MQMPVAADKTLQENELRYGFGKNWSEFIDAHLNDDIVEESRRHMAEMLRAQTLVGKVFLDIGCGSGIHSLAALRLGAARVISFDYDRDSVATTERVRKFADSPPNWEVIQGSVLDIDFMARLPKADIVYSWGVLHHTGDMWSAVRNAAIPLKADGVFYISLYSSDNYVNPPPAYWMRLKKRYNLASELGKRLITWQYVARFHLLTELKAGRNPLKLIRTYGSRGMTFWTDVADWLGGWPMDFASLAETQAFCHQQVDLTLVNVKTGEGCTEYLFARPAVNPHWGSIVAGRKLVPLPAPFLPQSGFSYAAALPALEKLSDSLAEPRRSQLMLYENGVMLGLAHSVHDHIARYGKGRFCHWGTNLYFSSSDGSDPNTNGYVYTYCEKF
jgi:2-polyprenyl-3-methyl-5-hydroxy-6-metoxy-1,4-benzoquinol methylase